MGAFLKRQWFFLLVAGFAIWWFFTGDDPVMLAKSFIGRGRRLATLHQDDNGDGIESVDDLVAAMSSAAGRQLDRDACLLAVVSASEHAHAGTKEKALIQRVVMNMAEFRGVSIESQITSGKGLGRQDGGRYVSSVNGGWEDDLQMAEGNIARTIPDDSMGAKNFVHKTGFKTLTDYQEVCDKWYARSGIVPVDVGGVSSLRIFLPEDQVASERIAS